MVAKFPKVDVDSNLINWAIDSAGWNREELFSKLNIGKKTFEEIAEGKGKLTLKQLEYLSNKTRRPIAAFFLPIPPIEKPLPTDYRMIPEREGKFDKKTIFAIRKARTLQELSKELSANVNEKLSPIVKKANLDDDPKTLAKYYREEVFKLGLSKRFRDDYDYYNFLRDKFEDLNIIPFQISLPIEDARGFALVDEIPNIIVVNSADEIRPRIFSLMHEFAHVLLEKSGIDMPEPNFNLRNKIELWCNHFSSEFLLPETTAIMIFKDYKENIREPEIIKKLSNKFHVSKGMLVYKMKILNFISSNDYNNFIEKYKKTEEKKKLAEKKGGGGIPVDKKRLSEMGNKFISLVANNYDRDFITYSDALNYLSIKSKSFEKLLSKARK